MRRSRRCGALGLWESCATAVCAMTIAGCAHQPGSGMKTSGRRDIVSGTVTYRERVALPPDAIAEVSLIDATASDATSPPVASTTVQSQGKQVPLPFSLRYDAGKIDKTHLYTIR